MELGITHDVLSLFDAIDVWNDDCLSTAIQYSRNPFGRVGRDSDDGSDAVYQGLSVSKLSVEVDKEKGACSPSLQASTRDPRSIR